MKITLSGKEFTLRCDFRAMDNFKREVGLDINKLDDDIVGIGKFVYYMAQSGAKYAGIPFKIELGDFLGLIDMSDMPALTTALTELLGGGAEKKR